MSVQSTMQDVPLTLAGLFRHGAQVHGGSRIHWLSAAGVLHSRTFSQVAARAGRLARALARLGIKIGDPVGTLAWNTPEHFEAYLALPAMGAVMHTLNPRLPSVDLAHVINDAGDRLLLVDETLLPRLAAIWLELSAPPQLVVIGDVRPDFAPGCHFFAELVGVGPGEDAAETELHAALDFLADLDDERAPAAICYTSGTTGRPKGVVYSHRSIYLHAMAINAGGCLGLSDLDAVLPIVPMFHVNAWGLPYAAWLAGADLVLPGRAPRPESLVPLISAARPTVLAGVPTVFHDLLAYGDREALDLSSVRLAVCGGAAVPKALMVAMEERYGLPLWQAWGMTETSPVAALARPPKDCGAAERWDYRERAGRLLPGIEARIVAESGAVLAADGTSIGEIEIRGPWVTGTYWREGAPEKFHDGWLRTGDLGSLDHRGYLTVADRAKDVIKSGGEWISSVALEGEIAAHPSVSEVAVIAVPDDRWQERPLALVVPRAGGSAHAGELRAHLECRAVARWWLPEKWAFLPSLPRTGVGKIDKRALRDRFARGEFQVVDIGEHNHAANSEANP